jgi:hypothetical protein
MSGKTVAAVLGAAMLGATLAAAPAAANSPKHTFNDVLLPNDQQGEIEATVHIKRNRPDSITCSYFTADYQESLGYYFAEEESAPSDSDAILAYCLDRFEHRHS